MSDIISTDGGRQEGKAVGAGSGGGGCVLSVKTRSAGVAGGLASLSLVGNSLERLGAMQIPSLTRGLLFPGTQGCGMMGRRARGKAFIYNKTKAPAQGPNPAITSSLSDTVVPPQLHHS